MARRVIPKADQAWLKGFRGYMHGQDLLACDMDAAAWHFNAGARTLSRRLREAGTSWKRELRAERLRRLESATAGGVIESGPYYTEVCGFLHPQSFYRAFKAWYGINFCDWREGRAA